MMWFLSYKELLLQNECQQHQPIFELLFCHPLFSFRSATYFPFRFFCTFLSLPLSHTDTHVLSFCVTHTHSLCHTHTHTLVTLVTFFLSVKILIQSLSFCPSLSLSHSLSNTLSLCLSTCLSLPLSHPLPLYVYKPAFCHFVK